MLTMGVVAVCQEDYTRLCLERLVRSSLAKQGKVNLVVVLNGAGSGLASAVESLDAKRCRLSTIVNAVNVGYAAACNQILQAAQTPYVGFVHNDVIVADSTLETLVYWLDRLSNRVVGILPLTNYANETFACVEDKHEAFMQIKRPNKEFMTREALLGELEQLYGNLDDYAARLREEHKNNPVVRCEETSSFCWVFRTRRLRELGGFCEDFPQRGYEDKELWLRMLKKDYDLALCRTTFAHHHGNLTTDGEGLTYPDVMRNHEAIYKRIAEQHLQLETPKELPSQRQLVYVGPDFREHLEAYHPTAGRRVLYFGTHYPPESAGGAELSLHETFGRLRHYGIESCAFTFRNRYHEKFQEFRSFDFESVRVFQVPEAGGEDLRQKFDFVVDRFRPDVVLTHSGYAHHALEFLAMHYPGVKRLFLFRHQTDLADGRLAAYLRDDGSTRIVSNSNWMSEVMHRACQRSSDVVLPVVTPKSCVASEPGEARGAVTIGNGVSSKGIRTLLDIAGQLADVPFSIWGSLDPEIPPSLLPTNATHHGWTSDLREIYAGARVVLNLSPDPEPFGRTLIEAMYNGVPVIARNAGGPREFVRHGGVLVEDFGEVPAIVRRLYEDRKYYDTLSEGAHLDVAQYNPYRQREKLISIILASLGLDMRPEYAF